MLAHPIYRASPSVVVTRRPTRAFLVRAGGRAEPGGPDVHAVTGLAAVAPEHGGIGGRATPPSRKSKRTYYPFLQPASP
jgi:hypothetical protein